MTDESPDPDESPDDCSDTSESSGLLASPARRREVLAGIATASVLGAVGGNAASSDPVAGIGGGKMADPIADLQIRVYEGTKADRPSAGVEDRYYYVDDPGHADHGAVYRDTGTSWELVDRKFGAVQAAQLSHDHVANVKNHGAVGDGSTDDLSAFEAARDSVPVGGTVYVPGDADSAPTYILSSFFDLKGRNLVGGGYKSHTIKIDPNSVDSDWTPTLNGKNLDDGVILATNDDDLLIWGVSVNCSNIDAAGLSIQGGTGVRVLFSKVENTPDSGIQFRGLTTDDIDSVRDSAMIGNYVTDAEWSFVFDGQVQFSKVADCTGHNCRHSHFHLDARQSTDTVSNMKSIGNSVTDCIFRKGQTGASDAIKTFKSQDVDITIEGNVVQDYPSGGAKLQGHVNLRGNTFRDCDIGIKLDAATLPAGSTVSGNEIISATTSGVKFTAKHGGVNILNNSINDTGTHFDFNGNYDSGYTIKGNVDANGGYIDPTTTHGSASKSDGDTIAHGLPEAPDLSATEVWSNSANRAYVKSVDATNITVGLVDAGGSAVTSDETLQYRAEV